MGMTVTVLGCSGSYPGPGGACSGYLVQGGGVKVVVDLGPGSLANLQHHVGLDDLDAVVLSHAHPDHWIDLTGLQVARRYALGLEGLPVYGTAGNRAKAEVLLDGLDPTFDWQDITDTSSLRIGSLSLDFSATRHYVETLAVRVAADDRVVAYSADTGPGWSFREFGDDIDLALCEASVLADGEADDVLHLSARQAGSMAADAGVSRLVLTHLQPGVDPAAARREASTTYRGSLEIAAENVSYGL